MKKKRIRLSELALAAEAFVTKGDPEACVPHGNGHINSTFIIPCRDARGRQYRYILQAINTDVFKNPEWVTENIKKVTDFLKPRASERRSVMQMVPTVSGEYTYTDKNGCWRMYEFIEDAICLDAPETTEDFYQSALAFGRFQRDLSDFPAEELKETIPDFHNTPVRYQNFLKALEEDAVGRASTVRSEVDFLKFRADFYGVLEDAREAGVLPLRVTHNDTKLNNVMLDKATRTALCVIDLDTVMPGYSVNDFGDAIRFGANTAAEDEPDLSRVAINLTLFEAYTKGFLEGCGGRLPLEEALLLPEGAKMMTLEVAMRFLTDYLQGDVYFKTKYPEHNLIRCRSQLALAADMEAHWEEMKDIVRACYKKA